MWIRQFNLNVTDFQQSLQELNKSKSMKKDENNLHHRKKKQGLIC